MIAKIIIPTLALLLAPLAGAETVIAGFSGGLPVGPGWSMIGGLPLNVVEDNGRKALSFTDDSETDSIALTYRLTQEQAFEVVSKGFTLFAQVRHVANGSNGSNFRLLVRIPGYGSVQLSTFGDALNEPKLGSYDSVNGRGIGVPLFPGPDGAYTSIKAIFRPGASMDGPGSLEVFLSDKPAFTVGLARGVSPHATLEVGGVGANGAPRTGQTFVSEVRMVTP